MSATSIRIATTIAIALSCANVAAAQSCTPGGSIPCVVRWYRLSPVISRAQSAGHEIELLSNGDALTAGTSQSSSFTDRIVLKFAADGTPTYGMGIDGLPWFIGAGSADDWTDFPWHELVVDEARGRFFVLFAGQSSPISGSYGYFLAAHSLATGERIPVWNSGFTQYVGPSPELIGGLDIDGNGDVWTVIEYSGIPGSMQVKKWSGSTGANITPSATPGEHISILPTTPGVQKHFQAFGVRKSDNKMFLAYRESPQDAAITLWSPTFTFVSRLDYSRELTPPAVLPPLYGCCGENMTDHPFFSDGFVDEQGRFVLAGTYRFRRTTSEFQMYFTFPAVVRFTVDAAGTGIQTNFEHYDDLHPVALHPEGTADPAPVRAVGDPAGRIFLQYVESSTLVHLVSETGSYVGHVYLPVPFSGNQGEPGCRYFGDAQVRALSYRQNRLVVAGMTRRLGNPCGDQDSTAFTISYGRDFVVRCCVMRPMPWDFDRYGWFFRDRMEGRRPPFPGPDPNPCPWCGEAPFMSQDFLRAVELLTSRRAPAEFPDSAAARVLRGFERTGTGPFFTDEMRRGLTERLSSVRDSKGVPEGLSQSVLTALNAALLDQRARPQARRAVVTRELAGPVTVDRISLRMPPGTSAGTLTVETRPALPGAVEQMEPVWPMATYRVAYSGRASARADTELTFDLHDMVFPAGTTALHVLQWDGKGYREVTSAFDLGRRTVTARTAALGEFVVMSSLAPSVARR